MSQSWARSRLHALLLNHCPQEEAISEHGSREAWGTRSPALGPAVLIRNGGLGFCAHRELHHRRVASSAIPPGPVSPRGSPGTRCMPGHRPADHRTLPFSFHPSRLISVTSEPGTDPGVQQVLSKCCRCVCTQKPRVFTCPLVFPPPRAAERQKGCVLPQGPRCLPRGSCRAGLTLHVHFPLGALGGRHGRSAATGTSLLQPLAASPPEPPMSLSSQDSTFSFLGLQQPQSVFITPRSGGCAPATQRQKSGAGGALDSFPCRDPISVSPASGSRG